MKCYQCDFMDDLGDGLDRCLNPNSIHFMDCTGVCCEDECDDGKVKADHSPAEETMTVLLVEPGTGDTLTAGLVR